MNEVTEFDAMYKREYPVQSKSYAFSEANRHIFNNDKDNPYISHPDKPLRWVHGDAVGVVGPADLSLERTGF